MNKNVIIDITSYIRHLTKKVIKVSLAMILVVEMLSGSITGVWKGFNSTKTEAADNDTITLRICNWEEYIDEGGWNADETIDLESTYIRGDNSMVDDFVQWYYKTYGKKVNVEYSCLGTNEELYNMLTLGDEYDLICPSEYMFMKLMTEGWLEPFSDEFYDTGIKENYYAKGVSPFIKQTFDNNTINGEPWSKYAAGYMWGVTGIIYNPEDVTKQEASTWKIINNDKFRRMITVKDNVRDTMFAAIGAIKSDKLRSQDFTRQADYTDKLAEVMNDTSKDTVDEVLEYLQQVKDNVYSFETDSGKIDAITGKISAGYQWSGDAVYIMQQAEANDVELNFAIPEECTNMYFDGWAMLKSGINGNSEKKKAAEAFVNFVSMPENAVRNMYYIGYTSVISGGQSPVIYDYLKWNYGLESLMEEDDTISEADAIDYSLGYFFSGVSNDSRYILRTSKAQTEGMLSAQYPTEEVMHRSAIMQYFDNDETARINQMWINVRCFNIHNVPVWVWIVAAVVIVAVIALRIADVIRHKKI